MKHFEPYPDRYCLHDTTVDRIRIKSDRIEFVFYKGVYVYDRDGEPTGTTGPCRMNVLIRDLDADRIFQHMEVKRVRNSRIKEMDVPGFLDLVNENGLKIYLDYVSFFANSVLLIGTVKQTEFQIRITEIDKIDFSGIVRKKSFSLCIWGHGPGRPGDADYVLESKTYRGNTVVLSFEGGETCIIKDPVNIVDTDTRLTVESASEIVWSQTWYGKTESENTKITIRYELTENGRVCVTDDSPLNRDQILSSDKRIAFDSGIRLIEAE